jgi:hypothetical protein
VREELVRLDLIDLEAGVSHGLDGPPIPIATHLVDVEPERIEHVHQDALWPMLAAHVFE